jgi:hypothetical protein
MTTLLRCHTPFFAGNRMVPRGTVVTDGDPIVTAGRRQFFAEFAPDGVEQATAAPGERRNTTVPPSRRRPKAKG